MKLFATISLALLLGSTNIFATEIKFGSVATDTPAAMVKRVTPMVEYLAQKTGYKVSLQLSPDITSSTDSLGLNTTQIAFLTPAAYVQAHKKYGVLPLVSFLQNGKNYFNLIIVVKKNGPIKTVKDLKGKTFAFGDKKAKLQPAVVIKSGIKLEELSSYQYLNHYDNIAKAVIHGDFDAGILTDAVVDRYKKLGTELRIIYVSDPLPSHVIAINNKVTPEVAHKLQEALLSLNGKNPKEKALIAGLESSYDGFQKGDDKDYDVVRTLSDSVK